jgi:predicted DNA-binding antitoxin AbrB/MazE fold protein
MRKLKAVYEGGVLRLTEKLPLEEHQLVTVIILDTDADNEEIEFEPAQCFEALANRSITRERVRDALSKIPGSLDADFAAERNERYAPGYFIDTSALV